MPKMVFPRFDGSGVRVWLDKCEAFFQLYHIPDNFKVASASLHLSDNAAHWYQAFKQSEGFHSWEQFVAAVIQEFDVDVYRQHMKELLMLKQTDTVELYKQKFLHIVYSVRLYEPTISDTFLVTRFVMGLKEELRAGLEVQIRQTVQMAAFYASVQEGLLAPQKSNKFQYPKQAYAKSDIRQVLAPGELWKAK